MHEHSVFSRWRLEFQLKLAAVAAHALSLSAKVLTLAEVRARVRCVGATADAAIMASRDIIVTRVSQKI
jgi:hypothetical protein